VVASSASLSSLAFLASLPALTQLRLRSSDALLPTLPATLPQVTSLEVRESRSNAAQLAAVMARFPALHTLSLHSAGHWSDFAFLQPVHQSLHTLQLIDCGHMSRDDAASLLELADCTSLRLTSLALRGTYDLDVVARRALQPPSALFSSLQHFEYQRE